MIRNKPTTWLRLLTTSAVVLDHAEAADMPALREAKHARSETVRNIADAVSNQVERYC